MKESEKSNLHKLSILLIILTGALCSYGCSEKQVAIAENEFEANQMFDILHSNGFRVEKQAPNGDSKVWQVTVDEGFFGDGESAAAIQVLQDYGLPRQPEAENNNPDSSLGIVSDREEKEKQKRELQKQIERQLYTLPDVIRANVIIALPIDDVLSLEKTPPTASVSLVLKETQPKFSITDVQGLVSGGVPKLKPENVKVAISQQAIREIPLEKIAAQRRSNAIFFFGICVIALLGTILCAVWIFAKRQKKDSFIASENIQEREFTDSQLRQQLNESSED